ncbi:glycoside hydrolase family 31 protein, partial [Aureobasidium melanogenum]
MKFRDGMWLVAEGKRLEYAEEVYSISEAQDSKKITLLCPTMQIRSRGDTLNRPTLTVDLEAVMDDVISVEVTHWHGALNKGPHFNLFPSGRPEVNASIQKTEQGTTISAGNLSATVSSKPHTFDIRFHSNDGKHKLTSLLNRSVGFAYDPATSSPMQTADMRDIKHYILTQSTLGVGEQIYGLGERFGALNKVGQSISLWNADGGTSSEQAYKNIPFLLSSKGYGIFIDTPGKVDLEVGSERCCRLQTSIQGQRLKWHIIYGPTPKDILDKYTTLTGKPAKVPSWSFGLWLSTSFTTSYDDKTVSSFLEGMKARDIPVQVFHYDCFWLRAFHWCDFVFSPDHFPDPKASISRLKASGLMNKVCVWINPYLGQASPIFAEAVSKNFLLKRKNGDVFQWDLWQTGMGIIDFTNPAAVEWYTSCLEKLFDIGVDSLKTDFGERIPSKDVQWFDTNVDPEKMHNYYAYIYNKVVYEALQKRFGKHEAVLFARAATAGTQQFPLQWGGDCESTFEAMAESLRGGLSLGMCGFSFWSVDIGGFEGKSTSVGYRVPWLVDDNDESEQGCSAVLRKFTQLKCRLMPYLYSTAMESIKHGWPVSVRAMAIEFPEDKTAWLCDQQFMLGSNLLIAPVFDERGEVEFYLPAGKWTSFWDGQVVEGPKWVKETHQFDTLPMYVREGSIFVFGKEREKRTTWDWTKDVEVKTFFPNEDSSFKLVDPDNKELATITVVKDGNDWKVKGAEALA